VVTRALEKARQDKVIGNSLEARVHLYVDEDMDAFLQPVTTDLPVLFIVSGVTVHPLAEKTAPTFEVDDVPGLAVGVSRATGAKCARCWMYHEQVGQNTEHPDTCPRCSTVLGARC